MAVIEWSDSLSVNVKTIDDQHKKLVEMLNNLHDAFIGNHGQDAQKAIVVGMVGYAATHFATEEKYMTQFNYPDYPAHKKEHDDFTAKAIDLKTRVENGSVVMTLDVINFLRDWLKNHISGTDKKYSKFFNDNGLS